MRGTYKHDLLYSRKENAAFLSTHKWATMSNTKIIQKSKLRCRPNVSRTKLNLQNVTFWAPHKHSFFCVSILARKLIVFLNTRKFAKMTRQPLIQQSKLRCRSNVSRTKLNLQNVTFWAPNKHFFFYVVFQF